MSNLWLNVRFGTYHLQGERGGGFHWSYNPFHENNPKWFALYTFFSYQSDELS